MRNESVEMASDDHINRQTQFNYHDTTYNFTQADGTFFPSIYPE